MSDRQERMDAQPPSQSQPSGGPGEEQLSPEQEQMMRQMEEEMRRVRVQDLVAQSVVSILNLAYRRIAKEDERDLEQARVGIEAVRALVEQLEPDAQREIRSALSQVQMLYARHAGETSVSDAPPSAGGGPATGPGPSADEAGGVRKPPPGLWVPGSD